MKIPLLLLKLCSCLSLLLSISCSQINEESKSPNILWIYLEDTSPLLGCYGTSIISTPNIDQLAREGVLYTNAIMPAPVCSPSRSTIITGMMSTTTGTHNHHSSRTPESAIYLPDSVLTLPEIFRNEGYYTFNTGKDDYNFDYDRRELYDQDYSVHALYGKRGDAIEISDLVQKQPFFGQIQLAGGKEIFSRQFDENVINPVDRDLVQLPPYLPDHPAIIEEYADHLDAIQITDRKVGKILADLESHDILDNTIVFFFSDHGMRLTRHKQFLYDGGLKVPMIIADFTRTKQLEPGRVDKNLVSGLDLGPVSLSLVGIEIPDYMEGVNFLDPSVSPREYVISTRDRCDFTIDRIRSVRSKKFKYIKNFMTDRPYTQTTYMDFDEVEFVRVMKQLNAEKKLDLAQERFMSERRPSEELYELTSDPFELNNLATNPTYTDTLAHYRNILNNWISATDDMGQYPESQEGLKLMLGIWGSHATNPEYEPIRQQFPELAGSLVRLKKSGWEKIE